MRRFNLPGDDDPVRKAIANAQCLELTLVRTEDGAVELSYKISGSIDREQQDSAIDPDDLQAFARQLMDEFGRAKK